MSQVQILKILSYPDCSSYRVINIILDDVNLRSTWIGSHRMCHKQLVHTHHYIFKIIIVKICEDGCLFVHAKTTERIHMKLYSNIYTYSLYNKVVPLST